MPPIASLLILSAFVITMIHAAGKAPLWPAVLLLVLWAGMSVCR